MFRNKLPLFSKTFYNLNKKKISSKEFPSNFDSQMNWILRGIIPGKSMAYALAGLNITIFLYSNLRTSSKSGYEAINGVSFSMQNLKSRDYIPLVMSLLGSRRIEDVLLESGLLLTVGNL